MSLQIFALTWFHCSSSLKMTMWADNVKFVKDILDSKYQKIDSAVLEVFFKEIITDKYNRQILQRNIKTSLKANIKQRIRLIGATEKYFFIGNSFKLGKSVVDGELLGC